MPSSGLMSTGGRSSVVALWMMLTVAAAGFATLLAGYLSAGTAWFAVGSIAMAGAVLLFMVTLFVTRAKPSWPAASTKPAFDYEQPAPLAPPLEPAADDLVEFSLVAEPPKPEPRPEGAWPEATEALWRKRRLERTQASNVGAFELPPSFQKRKEFTSTMPIVKRIFDDDPEPEEAPDPRDDKVRGQCGSCKTYMWAPKERPLKLRCPQCGKVALLTA
jgi:hypothetical protein